MIDNKIKNALAVANGLQRERYIDLVKENGEKLYSLEDELAILRKVVHVLIEKEAARDPSITELPEVKEHAEYFQFYENTKENAMKELVIHAEQTK